MSKIIDARGLSCPQPVILLMEEIKSGKNETITVLADNEPCVENVSRAAESKGFSVEITNEGNETHKLILKKL